MLFWTIFKRIHATVRRERFDRLCTKTAKNLNLSLSSVRHCNLETFIGNPDPGCTPEELGLTWNDVNNIFYAYAKEYRIPVDKD